MAIEALSNITRAGVGAFVTGGGGASASTATLNVNPAQYFQAVVTATDAAALATSSVLCHLAPTADWDADELDGFSVTATASAGAIDFCLMAPGPIGGAFKVIYTLG